MEDRPAFVTRILPREEWSRLVGTEAEAAIHGVDPTQTDVIVVEQADEIVGCWMLVRVPHVECLWIAPAHRKAAAVGRRLWAAMRRVASERGLSAVYTAAASDDVRGMLNRVGAQRIEADHYVVPIGPLPSRGVKSCPR